jgi:PKD repeat protein
VVLPAPLNLVNGTSYGFYIYPYSGQTYYDVTSSSSNPKSNSELSINAGESLGSIFCSGTGGGGSTVITGSRDWDGTFYYHYAACNSNRVSTTVNVLQSPSGAAISKGTPFTGSYNAGTAKNPDLLCLKDTNTYVLTPPTGMTSADFGTKWTITSLTFATATGVTTKDTIMRLPTATKNGYMKFFPSSFADSTFIIKTTVKIVASGCDSTMLRYVTVKSKPTAKFTIGNGCAGKVMAITNSSTPSTGLTYKWAFGNGDSASGAAPAYKYFSTGSYTVTLIATNGSCSSTTTQTVTVYPSPWGSNFTKGSPFSGVMNTGDIFDPDNVCATDTNTYQILAPKGLSNSDYGTKWTIVNMTFATIFGNKSTDSMFKKPTITKNATFSFFPANKWSDSVFMVRMTLRTLPGNCDSNLTRYIHVRFKPAAYFSATNACLGLPLTFKDTSKVKVSSIQGWSWNFGDGNTSIAQNPAHAYTVANKYNVKLTVVTDVGCAASITKTVEQYPRPATKIGAILACNTLPTSFIDSSTIASGSVTAWKWNFGDGTSSATTQTASHTYIKSGPYTVKLVTTSSFGCKDSTTRKIRILPKPHAAFSYLNACVGSIIYLGNTSTDSSNKTTFNWDFGDGATSTSTTPSHIYNSNGTYKISLKVISGNGCTDTTSQYITPYTKPSPKVTFVPACTGKPLLLTDSSGAPAGSTYTWTYGDGSSQYTTKAISTSHSYAKSGSYTVSLTITTPGGCADSQSKVVTVTDFPKPGFTATTVCAGKTTAFTNSSTGATSYLWDFGDGTAFSKTQNPSHPYSKAGTYTVKLLAYNSLGCADSTSKTVTVNPLPVIDKWARDQKGYSITFIPQDTTLGSFKWYFGTTTNDSSSLKKPTFTYPTSDGKYQVRLVVTSKAGCTSSRIDSAFTGIYGIDNHSGNLQGVNVFPNPFEGSTNISYTLTGRSRVVIKVYDVQGKEVATLKEGMYNAGNYTDAFDARKYNAGEGVYLLKMYVDDMYYTTRIVNMK